jgi:membrane protein implicated in regulation of membrane protease activity
MTALITAYWFAFGIGLVYVLLAGAIGALSHGIHAGAGHEGGADLGGDLDSADIDAVGGLEAAHGELDHAFEAHSAHAEGGQHDGAQSESHDGGASGQFQQYNPFSLLSLMGMLSGFGAGGLVGINLKLGVLSLGPAVIGAAASACLLWLIVGKLLYSLQSSSEAHVEDMIGLEATVITPVEYEMSGEIAYELGGTRYTAPARLAKPGRAAQHSKVRIRRVQGNLVTVEPQRKLLD